LKVFFTIAPLLIHVNPFRPFILNMDSVDFSIGIIFSQLKKDNFFHLVGFRFCKFSPIEINYEIHDKFLLTIVDAFK
jgi:hypothetical protein